MTFRLPIAGGGPPEPPGDRGRLEELLYALEGAVAELVRAVGLAEGQPPEAVGELDRLLVEATRLRNAVRERAFAALGRAK
jgi:hypothetical protein